MLRQITTLLALGIATVLVYACSGTMLSARSSGNLRAVVTPLQQSVVTVAVFDMDGDLTKIGSGFFIDDQGTLVTNFHVLDGAYKAVVKTADGEKYPISTVIAQNQLFDLMKVRVEIPPERSIPVVMAAKEPTIADRVVVIGSPMGFDQTISEGIISAIREHPANGKIFQVTAPISTGSSGGPAMNLNGEVVGIVTFQAAKGQNLNFAISVKVLQLLIDEPNEVPIAEWTLQKSGHDPRLAASLCSRGAQLSIRGKYEAALDYFQKATEINPDDPGAWHGLGSCYIGLNQPDDAIAAYHQSIDADPDNANTHFLLAMYHKALEQYPDAVDSLLRVIRIDPENVQARVELAGIYGELDQKGNQIETFEKILELRPDHVPTLHLMGTTARGLGHYDEALDLLLKASSIEPDNAQIHFDIGVTYRLKRLPEDELQAYARSIAADPRMAASHYNLGVLFLEQGNRKLALDQYEIIKNLDAEAATRLFEQIYPAALDETDPAL